MRVIVENDESDVIMAWRSDGDLKMGWWSDNDSMMGWWNDGGSWWHIEKCGDNRRNKKGEAKNKVVVWWW